MPPSIFGPRSGILQNKTYPLSTGKAYNYFRGFEVFLHRKDFFFISVLHFGLVVSKHKSVAAVRMSMHVTIKENFSGLKRPFHHQLNVVVFWEELT
jgi:hypothetical protein